ncbi:magnesium transporter [Ereboglobus sp. PH5-5]|uniref:magnesium transporter CorA family protein n=1 Tax=unclassified Ereboglobus TaxID=2626932 RepID=UPI002406076D|nr:MULTISPECIES: magnesium transporter CorA family protein [unclassified Ereboglobus]MDF9827805.1 magnesium transporter [Ereboglobus sp. PH5-10]MDF9833580.1 magnesium transporter [Ereboglobus sp. PH5-5]
MISSLVYRGNKFSALNPAPETLAAVREEPGALLWVDLSDPTDEEIKFILDSTFRFHPLAIEDCVSDAPVPKVEMYDDCMHLVMHAVTYDDEELFKTNEIDLFVGRNFLVSYHRNPQPLIESVLERMSKPSSAPVRGPDRFAHTILDGMVDGYKPFIETLRLQVEGLAQRVIQRIDAEELFPRIVALRKQLSQLRQIVRPQRAVALDLAQGKNRYIRKVMLPYFRDLEEELGRIENQAASLSDQLILSFRVFLNKSNHEANAGIRVMTAITALTFPTILIGGWYGMNFLDDMPELKMRYGYLSAAVAAVLGTVGVWIFMRCKKWL